MKNWLRRILLFTAYVIGCIELKAQDVIDTIHYNYGVWQYVGAPLPKNVYPELKGRLCSFRWADIETSPNVWTWSDFDYQLSIRAQDSLPIIFMVYTKQDAPDWLYSNGVPKVTEYDSTGNVSGYSPYYPDDNYKFYFKRMITNVRQHIETLPASVRMQIVAVQACFGSTGDFISYKGSVASKYRLSDSDFNALFQEFSLYYYNEYKTFNPKIYILSNPSNTGADQMDWLINNCPGGWIKTGSLGKGYQLNDEVTKASWLYNILNSPQNGEYVRARCEITGDGLYTGWWGTYTYRNMFALMAYDIFWGLDWSNQPNAYIQDHRFDSAFNFYNRYAGQKVPRNSNYAMCYLKDVIDASDTKRFPESVYGTAQKTTTRFYNVLEPFKPYGARLDDVKNAMPNEGTNINATGINDVGWNLFPGNYEKFLHQINPNGTSVGYWNVNSRDQNSMYGRFARGFDIAKNKTQLLFDVDSAFLNNAPLNAAYPVMVDVIYLDSGYGSWQLNYDAQAAPNKIAFKVTNTNSGLWKKKSITLTDAYFGNRANGSSDFYIKNTGTENVLFSLVELTRPNADLSGIGLSASKITKFDTLCVNSVSTAKSFTINGAFLTASTLTLGPLKGFKFSTQQGGGNYADSLVFKDVSAALTQTVYIKFYPTASTSYSGNIPFKGGGVKSINIPVSAVGVSSLPTLNPVVKNVSCYNAKDGSINLKPSGGIAPFSYSWKNNTNNFKSGNQSVSSLIPSVYSVVVTASGGCTTNTSFTITQPDPLNVKMKFDSLVCKGGYTNLYVSANGGTTPYNGTGTFLVNSGSKTYTVTDANGCSAKNKISIPNGTLSAPSKPGTITAKNNADVTGFCGPADYAFAIKSVSDATFYNWYSPAKSTISSTSDSGKTAVLSLQSGFGGGTIYVAAGNVCGVSGQTGKNLSITPQNPGTVSGPTSITSGQSGVKFSINTVPGLIYSWTVPGSVKINSGQGSGTISTTWASASGYVRVAAVNNCDSSAKASLYVTVGAAFASASSVQQTETVSPAGVMMVYPNPTHDVANLSFEAPQNGNYFIEISDLTGRSVTRNTFNAVKGTNNVQLNVKSFSNGIYMVTVTAAGGERKTLRLIKN